ncbi:MAG: cobalt-precorrin-5B (C(1))-methyltransferase, partial [Clostridia bacterium]|nr:cobalt-precorrin-5B (C(1))-methyltransferase [Clostridia bacterium]
MDSFITKDGKRLRRGYTTGSCAAAAAKAAAIMLFENRKLDKVYLLTPNGTGLYIAVHDIVRDKNTVSCSVVKDSGDDPDITNGIKVFAKVEKKDGINEITVCGGEGV